MAASSAGRTNAPVPAGGEDGNHAPSPPQADPPAPRVTPGTLKAAKPAAGDTPAAGPASAEADALDWTRVRSGATTGLFVLALLYTVYFAKAVLIPIVLALLFNLLLAPIVRTLRRYLRIPQGLGATLVLFFLLATLMAAFYGLSGPTSRWLGELPLAMLQIETKLRVLRGSVEGVQQAAKKVEELAGQGGGEDEQGPVPVAVQGPSLTQTMLGSTATLTIGAVVTVALLFFLLASGDTLLRQAVTAVPRLRDKRRLVEIVRETEDDISYYLLTISLVNLGLGCAVGIAMYLLGMPNPILWGVMAAVLNYVPVIGATVGIGVVGLVALLSFDSAWAILLPPAVYLALTSFEAQFVTPALVARRLTLNPVAVFIALILWTWMWGIAGALLAVPLLVTFKICCDHIEALQPIGTILGR